VSEKSITRQRAGLVRRAKTSCRYPADLAGACSGGKFVVARAGEADDAQPGNPNRKFRLRLWLGLLVTLTITTPASSLRAQDAAKTQQLPSNAQQQPNSQGQPKTVTCTVDLSPKVLSVPLAEALRLYRTGKFDDSVAAYNAIISVGSQDAVLAYTGLARVYLKQKKTNDAFAAASKAVALTPGKTPAITVLGEVYFRQGKLKEAEVSFLNPLRACDIDARSYLGLSKISRATSNYKRATDFVAQAYKLDPADPDIQRAYMATLNRGERLKFLRDYLSHETNDDAEHRKNLEHELAVLEDESAQSRHTCRLTSKVTSTQTGLEKLLYDPQRIRGYALKVKVNGASAKLLLDTGAGGIVIDKKIAERAGVKKVVENEARGVGDKAAASGYLGFVDSIQVGDLQFEGCYVEVVNRNSVIDDDGLVGADVFGSYLVDIDFPDAKFKLTQLPPYPAEVPAEATLESRPTSALHLHDRYIAPEMKDYTQVFRFGHALLIPTEVNDSAPMLFLIDTGASDNTITPEAAMQVTKISRDEHSHVKGLNGQVKDVYRADKANLKFAHFKQDGQDLVTFGLDHISNSIGTEVSGILGFRMLFLLDIEIDYRDGLVNFSYAPPGSKH
jgi:tetratricopeptide (TPR) repeat protein